MEFKLKCVHPYYDRELGKYMKKDEQIVVTTSTRAGKLISFGLIKIKSDIQHQFDCKSFCGTINTVISVNEKSMSGE